MRTLILCAALALAPARIANPPTSLQQYQSDGLTVIAQGGAVSGSTVVFKGYPSSTSSATASLRVEVKLVSQAFTDVATVESAQVPNGQQATVTATGLAAGSYKWQAWSYCT